MKVCPGCRRLVQAQELNRLAAAAEASLQAGQPADALQKWRQALELLPEASLQASHVRRRIDTLITLVDSSAHPTSLLGAIPKKVTTSLGVLGAVVLMAWKFKWLAALVLTKGKLLLFGLMKVSTLTSMGLSVLAYATAWGWNFAVGLVIIIYIHEMGHIYALRRMGIKAGAPLFIPGLGALVRLRQSFASPLEDARVGLAGPIWGLATAFATAGLYVLTHHALFGALTQVGAWINLFNLLPIASLDGGRGFRALSRRQRWLLLLIVFGALMASGCGLLVLILVAGGLRAVGEQLTNEVESRETFVSFAILIAVLSFFASFPGGGPVGRR